MNDDTIAQDDAVVEDDAWVKDGVVAEPAIAADDDAGMDHAAGSQGRALADDGQGKDRAVQAELRPVGVRMALWRYPRRMRADRAAYVLDNGNESEQGVCHLDKSELLPIFTGKVSEPADKPGRKDQALARHCLSWRRVRLALDKAGVARPRVGQRTGAACTSSSGSPCTMPCTRDASCWTVTCTEGALLFPESGSRSPAGVSHTARDRRMDGILSLAVPREQCDFP